MPIVQNLDELEQYLRKVMPQWKSVQYLRKNAQAGFVDFKWNGHHFAVKPTLESFELKDNKLYITGGSLLLQNALVIRTGNEAKFDAMAEILSKAEESVRSNADQALALVASVKKTIENMLAQHRLPTSGSSNVRPQPQAPHRVTA